MLSGCGTPYGTTTTNSPNSIWKNVAVKNNSATYYNPYTNEKFNSAISYTTEFAIAHAKNLCEDDSATKKKKHCFLYLTISGDKTSDIWNLRNKAKWNNQQNERDINVENKPPTVKPPKKVSKKNPNSSPEINSSLITIGSGSGFYINSKGYALTNNHVVDICKQSVAVVDGKETLFRVIATDKTNDVAVLKTDYISRNFIKINEDGAKLGENVIAVGYPLSGRLSDSVKITRGIVSSLSGIDNNIGQIQIDAALQPGNSGGPVLNENGELVGIASAGLNKLLMAKEAKYIPENVNFAVASPIVVNILKSKKVKYTTPSIFSGSYSNTDLAELGDSSTIQLFCRNTRTAYNRLKSSNKYSTVLLDLD